MTVVETEQVVQKHSGENFSEKKIYSSAIQFANSKSLVDFRIITEKQRTQASLINLARQGLAKISGFEDVTYSNTTSAAEKICGFCKRAFRAKSDRVRYCCMKHRVAAFRRDKKKQAKREG
jgi:hypothetical protein